MKTKSLFMILSLVFCFGSLGADKERTLPLARMTIKTVDENGQPVRDVQISLAFMDPKTFQAMAVQGLTDVAGFFSAEGGSDSHIGGQIQKIGYYDGGFPLPPFREVKEGRWQPWNATNIALMRKVENPVPVYAKSAWIEIPMTNAPCGYDLEVGDWVRPRGNGRVSDLVFALSKQFTNWDNFDVKVAITFSNPEDGILETKLPEEWRYSAFRWPRSAPDAGYLPAFSSHRSRKPGSYYQMDASKEQRFFFRTRTVVQDGRIVSARYGKISGGFELTPAESKTCKVKLSYYLNPKPLDRNMEFDPKQNLIKGLKFDEQPREP